MIVVRNGMPYLPRSVDTILAQTMREFELFVVNDGSTDDTGSYLASVSDPRVRFVDQTGSGIVAARNRCLAEPGCELIAQLDADDLAEPDRLARQLAWFEAHPDTALLGGRFDLIDQDERWLQQCLNVTDDTALRWALLFMNPFAASAVMYRRSDALAVGGFRSPYETCEDYDMWVRLAPRGAIRNLPERLCLRRMHPASISLHQHNRQLGAAGRIAREYAEMLGPEFDAAAHEALLLWFVYQTEPAVAQIGTLTSAYARARRWFLTRYPDSPPLNAVMNHTESILRYRCRSAARRSAGNPLTALRWLWTTRAFMPSSG
jgi:hypothetical protein